MIAKTVEWPLGNCDELLADVLGMGGHALLVEEVAFDAVRVAHHVERPLAQVRQRTVGDVEVVRDEVALRQADLREVELVRIRERDVVAADSHWSEVSAW